MTVDKNLFITLLHRYSGSTAEEAQRLISLRTQYPYCQIIHTLVARVSKDHGLADHPEALQLAAIHAADRSVLKEIMTAQPAADVPMNGGRSVVDEASKISEIQSYTIRSVDSGDVADEVIRDLEKLNASRHNFEMLFVEYSEVDTTPAVSTPEAVPPPKAAAPPSKAEGHAAARVLPKEEPASKDRSKTKKQRIIELARAMHVTDTEEIPQDEIKKKKEKASGKHNDPPDELIEEIRVSKEEIIPESEKQKEQIELINQFIKTQPSITSAKDRHGSPVGDLNPIKSGEFGDNIVSETLVEILVKQGKKDKAIEVLKKLIWKYPQKKSYFASQIEELKK